MFSFSSPQTVSTQNGSGPGSAGPGGGKGSSPTHPGFLLGGLAGFIVLLILPPPQGLSPVGWRMAAIALLMAFWWISEALPLAITALLPLVLYPALGILSSGKTSINYGNHLVFLFLGGFMIAIAMERWNLHRRLALGLVARVGTKPRRLLLGFLLSSAFLSAWISNTATTLMLLPIAMAVVRTLAEHSEKENGPEAGEQVQKNLGAALMLALAFGAGVGGLATLVGTPPNIVLAGQTHTLFPDLPEISFGRWMMLGVPISLTMLAAAYLVLMRFGPHGALPEESLGEGGRKILREQRARLGPMNSGEKQVLACFLLTVALWLTRKPLALGAFTIPGWSQLFAKPSYLHDTSVAIGVGILLTMLRAKVPGEEFSVPLLDFKSIREKAPWGILLLFGGGFALAQGFHESGLALWIGNRLVGLGGLPLPLIMMLTSLVTMAMTEVTSNTATSTLLMPILAAVAVSLKVPPLLLMVPAALSASLAFMLPVATPPNAIVFGSGWITIRQMARVGLVLNLIGVVVVTAYCYWLAPIVLGPGAR